MPVLLTRVLAGLHCLWQVFHLQDEEVFPPEAGLRRD